MISIYLNQKAVWGKATGGMDSYGNPVTVDKEIKVRWEDKRQLVRDVRGREVVSEARVLTKEAIQPGDLLTYGGKAFSAIAVSVVPDLNGVEHYRGVSV